MRERSTKPDPYREYLGALSRDAARRKAEAGVYVGKPLNGYMKVDWTDVHQVDEGKRKQIRLIFREAAKGRSYRRLLRICEEVGLTNASGGPMGLSSLHNMLTNPFYYGYVTVDGTPVQGKHQPIVEATLPKIKKDQQKTSSLLVESRPWSNAHEI